MSRAVVWDVGNVLIRWDPRAVWREDFADEAALDAFMDETGFDAWNLEQDRGRSWADAVEAQRRAHPAHVHHYEKFARDWHRAVPGEIPGSVAILDAMRTAGVPLYAVTNFSGEKWAETRARFPFLAESFRDVVVSAHERVVKPDPAIFRVLLDRNGLDPAACLFIDDSPRNTEAARALGMDAIRFAGPEALATDLAARGLA